MDARIKDFVDVQRQKQKAKNEIKHMIHAYPDTNTLILAKKYNMSVYDVYQVAYKYKVKKSKTVKN